MNDLKNNPKKFLKIQITNFARRLFTIFYLDELTRAIHHTEPSDNTLLSNLNNFSIEWAFSQKNTPQDNNINPKILPNPTTNVEIIHINFNYKQYSNNKDNKDNNSVIQITSRLLSSRNAHKVFTVTTNYMDKFPSIPTGLQNQLISYQHSLQQSSSPTKYHQQNSTPQGPITNQPIQTSIPNQTTNQIHSQKPITNTPQTTTTNSTDTIIKTNKQSLHNPLPISDKQSTSIGQSKDKPLFLSDLSSNINSLEPS